MDGLLEVLLDDEFLGRADLPHLAEEAELDDDTLLPLAHALHLLGLAHLAEGDMTLTALGRRYVDGNRVIRQELFGKQVLAHVPLVAHIRHSLEQSPGGQLPEEPFLRLLRDHLSHDESERVLKTAIEWARHGEVLEYNYHTGLIHLPDGSDSEE
jgi:NitT/TauT family transport system ATP-binding protein